MRTITIQIGNSDNKLTQREWSEFVQSVGWQIAKVYQAKIHFHGGAAFDSEFQNAAWVIDAPAMLAEENALCHRLTGIAGRFGQDSIAWTVGASQLVKA
jgi:hypothetical protein